MDFISETKSMFVHFESPDENMYGNQKLPIIGWFVEKNKMPDAVVLLPYNGELTTASTHLQHTHKAKIMMG